MTQCRTLQKLLAVEKESSVTMTLHSTDTIRRFPRAARSCPGLCYLLPASPHLETVGNGKSAITFCPQLGTEETENSKGYQPSLLLPLRSGGEFLIKIPACAMKTGRDAFQPTLP